jgi:hypothetical protein
MKVKIVAPDEGMRDGQTTDCHNVRPVYPVFVHILLPRNSRHIKSYAGFKLGYSLAWSPLSTCSKYESPNSWISPVSNFT